jgi:hypothetical protein
MPRYFFDTTNARTDCDDAGMELPDANAALCEVIRYAGSILHHSPEELLNDDELTVTARSETGVPIATLLVRLIDRPA